MPDFLAVLCRWWKMMLVVCLLATTIGTGISLLLPKKFLSVATALPSSSVLADKARIFDNSIQALYSSFGSADELDKFEGLANLDTLFIAVAKEQNLASHYNYSARPDALFKAAKKLKKANSRIEKNGYGELKVKVWDRSPMLAATIANSLMQKMQALLLHLQNQTNAATLQTLQQEYAKKLQQYNALATGAASSHTVGQMDAPGEAVLMQQLQQYQQLISEYQIALASSPQLLLVVEPGRPAMHADKPEVLLTAVLSFLAALITSFLVAVFLFSKKSLS